MSGRTGSYSLFIIPLIVLLFVGVYASFFGPTNEELFTCSFILDNTLFSDIKIKNESCKLEHDACRSNILTRLFKLSAVDTGTVYIRINDQSSYEQTYSIMETKEESRTITLCYKGELLENQSVDIIAYDQYGSAVAQKTIRVVTK